MRKLLISVGAGALVATGLVAPATAGTESAEPTGQSGVYTVFRGLDGPRELQFISGRTLVVAESDTGEVTRANIFSDQSTTLVKGLVSPQGVDARGNKLYIATGVSMGGGGGGTLATAPRTGGNASQLADLLEYELANNPDGQVQFVDGQPVDALSNPYFVHARMHDILVADAGANDVLSVDRFTGKVRTFFVPPTIRSGVCKNADNNPGTTGCDSVPTGIAEGPDGRIYVSTLGAEAPNAARIYRLHPGTGAIERTYGGLTGATGVAVGDDGSIYVSELLFGVPEGDGPPPPGFDPADVGRIHKIAPNGSRSIAQVTMPAGLTFHRGDLYASAWSIAGFLGLQGRGEIVRVTDRAFG